MPVILQPPLSPGGGRPRCPRPPKCRIGRGRAWFAVALWLVVAVGGFALGSAVFGRLTTSVGTAPGSESDRAADALARIGSAQDAGPGSGSGTGTGPGTGETVTAVIGGRDAADPEFAAQVRSAADRARALPGVVSVVDPYTSPAALPPARDGRSVLVRVEVAWRPGAPTVEATARDAARILHGIDAPRVRVGGGPLLTAEMNDQAERDLNRAELISLPIVVLLLLVVFGGVVAAGLPLAVALVGIASTFLVLYGFSLVTDVSVYAVQVTTMLGLGLAVDYALLIVTRFREELARDTGPDADGTENSRAGDGADATEAAVRRTSATAGRTVLVSGLTVSAGLAGLLVFPDPFLRGIGMAGAAVVAIDMIAALTLLPALLRLFGHRIPAARAKAREGRVFARAAALVGRRPVVVLSLLAAALAILAAPAAGLRLSGGDARSLPGSSESRQVYEQVRDDFGTQYVADPVDVLVKAKPGNPGGTGAPGGKGHQVEPGVAEPPAAIERFAADVARLPGVREATPRQGPDGSAVLTVRVDLPADTPSDGGPAQRVVRDIRELRGLPPYSGLDVQVTGPAARLVDYHAMLADRLPYAAAVILLATLALLFAFTGSVLLPIKAVLSNVLAVGASLGIVVWLFQDGHFGQGLGAVDATAPVLIAAIAFGLSMDYEVFLLSRIREEWLDGRDPRTAVGEGLRRSGRVVTGAALLLVVVFAAFTTGGFSPIRQIGLGLALAIVLDATVVRMLAVPAAMTLLGRAAWWAPGPLRRWHDRHGLTEGPAGAATRAGTRAGARTGTGAAQRGTTAVAVPALVGGHGDDSDQAPPRSS
ncbi:MMPL family transporter [Streptodolium elevatio]|uniref:MMPL family transporter n=1 Tax=Streptodolium elevatio TaxID=3157996 RepID=A0ABV3DMM4_9ACTN